MGILITSEFSKQPLASTMAWNILHVTALVQVTFAPGDTSLVCWCHCIQLGQLMELTGQHAKVTEIHFAVPGT